MSSTRAAASASIGEPFVIVVSGIPRSGTSLMMRILERAGVPILSDGVRAADADNPHGYYELEAAKRLRDDAGFLEGALGHAVKVVHMLLPHLPLDRRYRVLVMRRDLDEVMRSQARMLERLGEAGDGDRDAALTAAFEKQLAQNDDFMLRQPSFAAIDVDYRRLIDDPIPELEAVMDFLGLDADVQALAEEIDPSLHRQRKGADAVRRGAGGD